MIDHFTGTSAGFCKRTGNRGQLRGTVAGGANIVKAGDDHVLGTVNPSAFQGDQGRKRHIVVGTDNSLRKFQLRGKEGFRRLSAILPPEETVKNSLLFYGDLVTLPMAVGFACIFVAVPEM